MDGAQYLRRSASLVTRNARHQAGGKDEQGVNVSRDEADDGDRKENERHNRGDAVEQVLAAVEIEDLRAELLRLDPGEGNLRHDGNHDQEPGQIAPPLSCL